MRRTHGLVAALGAVGLSMLAGCGAQGSGNGDGGGSGGGTAATSGGAKTTTLITGKSALGTIVDTGKGMTVYYYDKDVANSGKSTCYGGCAALWPAVTTTAATPSVTGVTGKVGTITRTDGSTQVTVNGLPVYTYAADPSAGDINGQGVGGIWWVVAPNGDKIAKAASSTSGSSSGSSSGSGYGY